MWNSLALRAGEAIIIIRERERQRERQSDGPHRIH